MAYRTRVYIAGDWDGDKNAISQLYHWNNSNYWSLSFTDAHDLTQSRDTSLNCSIKHSLKNRMDASKTFVLIVGDKTKSLRSGSCYLCPSYNHYSGYCTRGYNVDPRSYVDYECDKAVEAGIKIVVLYNSSIVERSKCPPVLQYRGLHIPMLCWNNGLTWNYSAIKNAIQG